MMDSTGYIKLHRKAYDNFLYNENRPATRREAWEDILINVNYADSKCLIGSELLECKRGQSLLSLDSWGRMFRWDKSKVRRFFNLLQSHSMVCIENLTKTTRLTVCNYELYQGDRNASETHLKRKRNAPETHLTPIEEEEEEEEQEEKKEIYTFDQFWNEYDKKTDRKKCELKWKSITETQKALIKEHVPKYVLSTPDIQYRKDPKTYLNNECWNNEIIQRGLAKLPPPNYNPSWERWDGQKRWHGKQEIPYDAPPRPSNMEKWDNEKQKWTFSNF